MTAPQDALLVFQPSGRKGRFPIGTPVLDAARELGVYVESVCGGRGICGKCQVSVASGKFAKFGIESSEEGLSPKGFKEERYDDKRGLEPGMRLSCSATLQGDIVIDIPPRRVPRGWTNHPQGRKHRGHVAGPRRSGFAMSSLTSRICTIL